METANTGIIHKKNNMAKYNNRNVCSTKLIFKVTFLFVLFQVKLQIQKAITR